MEKIAIAIKKLPAEYQPVLTAEMRKEGSLFVASYIENAAFQDWQSVHSSYVVNLVINSSSGKNKIRQEKWLLWHSMEPATDVVNRATRKLIVMPRNISMEKHLLLEVGGVGSSNEQGNNNKGGNNNNQKKKRFQGTCNYCGKLGHKEVDCRKKAAEHQEWRQRNSCCCWE